MKIYKTICLDENDAKAIIAEKYGISEYDIEIEVEDSENEYGKHFVEFKFSQLVQDDYDDTWRGLKANNKG